MIEPFDVAVVMPHYNQPQCLRRAVAALRDQRTERRLQVVIVDDGRVCLMLASGFHFL